MDGAPANVLHSASQSDTRISSIRISKTQPPFHSFLLLSRYDALSHPAHTSRNAAYFPAADSDRVICHIPQAPQGFCEIAGVEYPLVIMGSLCLTWSLFDRRSQKFDEAVPSGLSLILRSNHTAMVRATVVYKTWPCTPALEQSSGLSVSSPPPEESRSY